MPVDPAQFLDWTEAETLLEEGDYDAWFRRASVGCLMSPMPVRGGVTKIGGVVIRAYDTTEAQLAEIRSRYADLERQRDAAIAERDALYITISDLRGQLARAQGQEGPSDAQDQAGPSDAQDQAGPSDAQDQAGPSDTQEYTAGPSSPASPVPMHFRDEVFSVARVEFVTSPSPVEVPAAEPEVEADIVPAAEDVPESAPVAETAPAASADVDMDSAMDAAVVEPTVETTVMEEATADPVEPEVEMTATEPVEPEVDVPGTSAPAGPAMEAIEETPAAADPSADSSRTDSDPDSTGYVDTSGMTRSTARNIVRYVFERRRSTGRGRGRGRGRSRRGGPAWPLD